MRLNEIRGNRVTIPGNNTNPFPKYVNSKEEFAKLLIDYYGKVTMISIFKSFADYNVVLTDDNILDLPVKSLLAYQEYERDPSSGWTGSNTKKEYEELKQNIKQNGIQTPIVLRLERKDNDDVDVYIGEGNHRLRIAQELGITHVQVQLYYVK